MSTAIALPDRAAAGLSGEATWFANNRSIRSAASRSKFFSRSTDILSVCDYDIGVSYRDHVEKCVKVRGIDQHFS